MQYNQRCQRSWLNVLDLLVLLTFFCVLGYEVRQLPPQGPFGRYFVFRRLRIGQKHLFHSTGFTSLGMSSFQRKELLPFYGKII